MSKIINKQINKATRQEKQPHAHRKVAKKAKKNWLPEGAKISSDLEVNDIK
jgi:hypothetical protein